MRWGREAPRWRFSRAIFGAFQSHEYFPKLQPPPAEGELETEHLTRVTRPDVWLVFPSQGNC